MPHGTEQHLEHAEHAQHAALNPFDRQVAMTMAIMAAGLAGVTLLSHRGHNDILGLKTEANIKHTQASDQWNFYQAKNIRNYEFKAFRSLASFVAAAEDPKAEQERAKALKDWTKQIEKYEGKGRSESDRTKAGELAELMAQAREYEKEAKEKEHQSHILHHSVNWIDIGHLGLEFALVLCSVAVLTKQRGFWFSGIGVALVGAGLAAFGGYGMLTMHH